MRVIGGTFGGRRLRPVEGHGTRPTSDRVREALFSRIEARYGLAGASVLDVFAGTGALAIEAISRGASRAVCIELERKALETLRGNLREFELARQVRVISDDFRKVLARLAGEDRSGQHAALRGGLAQAPERPPAVRGVAEAPRSGAAPKRRFDGAFVDPPYGKGLALDALALIADLDLVRAGGWITVEVGRREELPDAVEAPRVRLTRVRDDTYGDTRLALYEASAPVVPNQHAGDEESPAAEVER